MCSPSKQGQGKGCRGMANASSWGGEQGSKGDGKGRLLVGRDQIGDGHLSVQLRQEDRHLSKLPPICTVI